MRRTAHCRRSLITQVRRCSTCRARCRMCAMARSEEHTSELQSPCNLVCRLLLEKKKESECDGKTQTTVSTYVLRAADVVQLTIRTHPRYFNTYQHSKHIATEQ